MEKSHHGYLELILGSMFSGKTSYLLDVYKKCMFCNIPVAVINYAADDRYTSEPMLSTHDKQMIPCILATTISDAIQNNSEMIARVETILINEGQFFPDIEDQVKQLVEVGNKRVYICGLDGDFERKPIGNLLQLVPFSDHIIKLKSLCSLCRDGTPGVFSFRTSREVDQVVIGSSNYVPLCRGCYQKAAHCKAEGGVFLWVMKHAEINRLTNSKLGLKEGIIMALMNRFMGIEMPSVHDWAPGPLSDTTRLSTAE